MTIAPAFPLPEPKTAPADVLRCAKLRIIAIPANDKEMIPCVRLFLERAGSPDRALLARHPAIKLIRAITPPANDLARPGVMPVTALEVSLPAGCANIFSGIRKESAISKQPDKMNGAYFFIVTC